MLALYFLRFASFVNNKIPSDFANSVKNTARIDNAHDRVSEYNQSRKGRAHWDKMPEGDKKRAAWFINRLYREGVRHKPENYELDIVKFLYWAL